jgi:hypothetical protein
MVQRICAHLGWSLDNAWEHGTDERFVPFHDNYVEAPPSTIHAFGCLPTKHASPTNSADHDSDSDYEQDD